MGKSKMPGKMKEYQANYEVNYIYNEPYYSETAKVWGVRELHGTNTVNHRFNAANDIKASKAAEMHGRELKSKTNNCKKVILESLIRCENIIAGNKEIQ